MTRGRQNLLLLFPLTQVPRTSHDFHQLRAKGAVLRYNTGLSIQLGNTAFGTIGSSTCWFAPAISQDTSFLVKNIASILRYRSEMASVSQSSRKHESHINKHCLLFTAVLQIWPFSRKCDSSCNFWNFFFTKTVNLHFQVFAEKIFTIFMCLWLVTKEFVNLLNRWFYPAASDNFCTLKKTAQLNKEMPCDYKGLLRDVTPSAAWFIVNILPLSITSQSNLPQCSTLNLSILPLLHNWNLRLRLLLRYKSLSAAPHALLFLHSAGRTSWKKV